MTKKHWRVLILAVLLGMVMIFAGCGAMMQLVFQTIGQPEPTIEPLPTHQEDEAKYESPLIPLDVIMQFIEYTPPNISDDGSKILYRHMEGFSDSVVVADWKTGKEIPVPWPDELRGIPYVYTWGNDGETILFFADYMGDENKGLYTANIKTGKTKTVLPASVNDCYYISDNPKNDKEIYIELFDYDEEVFDLYLINYETGKKKLVFENPGDITEFIFDRDGNLRIVSFTDDQAGKHVWMKKDIAGHNTRFVESEWEEIFTWDYEDAQGSRVYGFMMDGERVLYMDTSISDTASLCIYDPKTKQKQVVYNDPDYEIYGTWTDIEMDEVVSVSVYGEKIEWAILDESFQDDYDVLTEVGDVFEIIGSSEDDHYWVVAYPSDVKYEDYYIYDMKTKEMTFLYNAKADMADYEFASREPISYTASDGLKIEGYATFPAGMEKKDLPTVVLVHGGPWARDMWVFDPEAQFLANRGYLVLQLNFRGSTGYGKDFVLAGDREWGRAMHQDILDGVAYAVEQGWADEDRIGVYGASYGGYEALVCAAFSSDVFQCAVDAFGPSSLLTFVESLPPQWSVAYDELLRAIGDPKKDTEMMKERSPLYHVDDIKIPMLIAQGENDIRVVKSESIQMKEALEAAGLPVTFMLFPDTGHGFSSMETRMQFYSEMERFFAEHLGGRTE